MRSLLPSGRARAAACRTSIKRVSSFRLAQYSRKKASMPGLAGSTLRMRSNHGSASAGFSSFFQCSIAICSMSPTRSASPPDCRLHLALVQRDQLCPALGARVQIRQEFLGFGVFGRVPQHAGRTRAPRAPCRPTLARRCAPGARPPRRATARVSPRSRERSSTPATSSWRPFWRYRCSSRRPAASFVGSSRTACSSRSTAASKAASSRAEAHVHLGGAHQHRALVGLVAGAFGLAQVAGAQLGVASAATLLLFELCDASLSSGDSSSSRK